jgi:hypothetical protein
MKKEYYFLMGGIILLIYLFKKPIAKGLNIMTRGYKNNNFGNIVKTFKNGVQTFWEGEIKGEDERFKTFKNPAFGYRAIFVLLDSYFEKGRNTIEKIISVYAPSNENNTKSYINSVSKITNLQQDEALTKNDFIKIVKAISFVENGIKPNESDILEGFKLYNNV